MPNERDPVLVLVTPIAGRSLSRMALGWAKDKRVDRGIFSATFQFQAECALLGEKAGPLR